MEGGVGISSYSRNSSNQGSAFLLIAPALRVAIAAHDFADHTAAPLRIADLGCAVGSNTITAVAFVIKAVRDKFKSSGLREPEVQALFSDLVSNDFNTLFQHLEGADFFVAGVPGSFYHRLFPSSSIHFSMCNVALQWLSKASERFLSHLFQRPWLTEDLRPGTLEESLLEDQHQRLLERSRRKPTKISAATWLVELKRLSLAASSPSSLKRTNPLCFAQGLIDEETRDSFNIPAYHRTLDEIAKAVSDSGDVFTILQLEELKCPMPTYASVKAKVEAGGGKAPTPQEYAGIETMAMKSTMKKQIEAHLKTPDLVEALFKRLEERFLPKEPYVPARHVKMALAILERGSK
ncbi:gibberellic acid methyltransferase 2 [Selaginella moellendorffii]|uniref:gibberellic acid methyltransferase 2 n=1 Tax=Selaginella moellendorffii TaxID=88036 RepID=UPI000D1D074C|nr:gibberellic acid methyltransferase 2 [Selaginella moellendorffii]|eukprot:XP_024527498.1 gibberellic acid methyltransferase 2 [Selaginella moellendorffii]